MNRLLELTIVLFFSPLWLLILAILSVIVFLADGRPVFFRQVRSGLGGKSFTILKFRTMKNSGGGDAQRLTKFGRILRKTSLDELPQLINVLKGEMALVGPRPLPEKYLAAYTPFQRRRLEVKPGLTGLAQVNGRNLLDWEEKFDLDVRYVDERSLSLDLKILVRTVQEVFLARGISHDGEATMKEFEGSGQA